MFGLWLVFNALLFSARARQSRTYPDEECALTLSPSGNPAKIDRNLCIRYEDVDEAFFLARHKCLLRQPAREMTDLTLNDLGVALQETTRILANRFSLTRREVETELIRVDTRRTEIGRYCAGAFRHGGGGGGGELCREERYRRHDATCNNIQHPFRGAALLPFSRLLLPQYADRISEPRVGRDGFPLPSPRVVSTTVHGDTSTKHAHRISLMFPSWGQLVDHDLTLTAETKDPETRKELDCCVDISERHPNCMPMEIPRDDSFYGSSKQTCMNFIRSLAGVRADCRLGSRVQTNLLTSYMDANFVYGSRLSLANSLREMRGGLLKVTPAFERYDLKPILPPKINQPDDGCIRPNPDVFCFLAGDNRVNEQLALGVLHTLIAREHNRIATQLSKINPYWDDETLYQETRHIIAAIVQHITYNEFLPQLLGESLVERYGLKLKSQGYSKDYDPSVDPSIPASFGAAAFRFGHSLLPNAMELRSATHKLIGETKLSAMLQQPYDLYKSGYVDAYTLGMVNQLAQAMDSSITHQVTNHLYQEPTKKFGRDLAAINIARAREHGIPGYMAYRKYCGLDDMTSWEDMWNHLPNDTIKHYLHLYSHPDDVDLWSAGVSEQPAPGSMIGPVFACIIATTFRNLKKGDRFWYENQGYRNSFTLGQLNQIRKYTLARLICNTGDNIQTIQSRAMLLPDYNENPRLSCRSGQIPDIDLSFWKDKSYYEEQVVQSDHDTYKPDGKPIVNDTYYDVYEKPPPLPVYGPPSTTSYEEFHYKPTTETSTTDSHGYHYGWPTVKPVHQESTKPPGFDQVIYNLFNMPKNNSEFIIHLSDTLGINEIDHSDHRRGLLNRANQ